MNIAVDFAAWREDELGLRTVGLYEAPAGAAGSLLLTEDPDEDKNISYCLIRDGGATAYGGLVGLDSTADGTWLLRLNDAAARLLGLPPDVTLDFRCEAAMREEADRPAQGARRPCCLVTIEVTFS